MFHRTQRLFLRPGFSEDWRAILAAIGDEAIVRNLARAPWPYREKDAREFAALAQDWRHPHFLVTLPGIGVIGSAGLGKYRGESEIGYWIARDFWGRGFATEAARAVVEIAQMLGHKRLIASHFIDNPASGRVLEKLGFTSRGRVQPRHSLARGADADAVEYELASIEDAAPWPQAA